MFGEGARVELLVQDATRCRHPLHIARPDHAARARRILVLHFTLVDDRHGLETAVRMLPHATRARGRIELEWCGMIEQQERAQLPSQSVVTKQRTHRKAIAHPVRARRAVRSENLLHPMLLARCQVDGCGRIRRQRRRLKPAKPVCRVAAFATVLRQPDQSSNGASAGQTCSSTFGCACAVGWIVSVWNWERSVAMGSSRNGRKAMSFSCASAPNMPRKASA